MNNYYFIPLLVLVSLILILLIGLIWWLVVNTRRQNRVLALNIRLGLSRRQEAEKARLPKNQTNHDTY